MKFEEALKAMREGKKVARNSNFYQRYFVDAIYIEDDNILWQCIDDEDYILEFEYGLSSDDILAEDWEIVE